KGSCMNNESLSIFLRLVHERHTQLKGEVTSLSKVFLEGNKEQKQAQAVKCNDSANDLARALAAKDQPAWLKELIRWTDWYINNYKSGDAAFTAFQKIMPHI